MEKLLAAKSVLLMVTMYNLLIYHAKKLIIARQLMVITKTVQIVN